MLFVRQALKAIAFSILKIKETTERLLASRSHKPQRVNPPPPHPSSFEYVDYTDTNHDHLHHLLNRPLGDGLWTCCHGHEQELIHYTGPHPFQELSCFLCTHILCRHCCTTSVLNLLTHHQDLVTAYPSTAGPLPYGQICPNCGLSHRAMILPSRSEPASTEFLVTVTFKGVMCDCGRLDDVSWLRFWIGPCDEYWRRPHEAFSGLSRMRAEGAVGRQRIGVEAFA